jgi:hypothetical protein
MKTTWFFAAILVGGLTSVCFAYSGGDGTAANPYQIASKTDLLALRATTTDYSKCFILTADIDMTGHTFTTAIIAPNTNTTTEEFQGTSFSGCFNGNHKLIMNLTIDTAGAGNNYLGLFGSISGDAQVKSLGIENIFIAGGSNSEFIGGLCGRKYFGRISNCYVTGVVTGGTESFTIGGLCGLNSSGMIIDCYAIVQVGGGISSSRVGGLCGFNYRAGISNCYATGSVSGGNYLGGLCGTTQGDTISNCYAIGSVTGRNYLGGLCGSNSYSMIANCYSTGIITGDQYKGGFCGTNFGSIITSCFWGKQTSGMTTSSCGTGKATAEMMTLSTFTLAGWDFTNETANGTNNIWRMCADGVDYPRLNWESVDGDFACPDGVSVEDLDYFVGRWLLSNCTSSNNYCGGGGYERFRRGGFGRFCGFGRALAGRRMNF